MVAPFPFGKVVILHARQPDGSFAAGVAVRGCAIAPREQAEGPVPSWPPLSSGRTVYAPAGTVAASKDRAVVDGVTFEVDGDPMDWDSPFTGLRAGVEIQLRRADNWFDTTVSVRTYLGSSGWGATFADPVSWPANVVSVSALDATTAGDEVQAKVTLRVPPENDSADALAVFTPGSLLTVAGAEATVSQVQPFTRGGFTEYVEVQGV